MPTTLELYTQTLKSLFNLYSVALEDYRLESTRQLTGLYNLMYGNVLAAAVQTQIETIVATLSGSVETAEATFTANDPSEPVEHEQLEALITLYKAAIASYKALVATHKSDLAGITALTAVCQTTVNDLLWTLTNEAARIESVTIVDYPKSAVSAEISGYSASRTPSRTPSPSATPSQTPSASATPSSTPSPSATPSQTPSTTPSPSATPSQTPSTTPSPSATPSQTPSTTPSPSATPSATPEG